MIARLQFTARLMRAGLYETRAAAGITLVIAGAIVEIAHKLVEQPTIVDSLPPLAQRAVHALLALAPVAELLVLVGGAMAAQGKALLPAVPVTGAPSLLDHEAGGDSAREFVPWT